MANKPLSNEKDGVKINADKLVLFTVMTDIVAGKVIKAVALHEQHNCFDKIAGTYTNNYTPDFSADSQEYAYYQPFKNMLDSNNQAWLNRCITDRNNGLKGGHSKHKKPTGNPVEPTGNPTVTKNNPTKPDNVNVNDKRIIDNANANVNIHTDNDSILDRLTDEEYKLVEKHCTSMIAVSDRISEKKNLDEIEHYYQYFVSVAQGMGEWT